MSKLLWAASRSAKPAVLLAYVVLACTGPSPHTCPPAGSADTDCHLPQSAVAPTLFLPLARPGLIALTIFTFIGTYQSFFWPLVMLKTVAKYTLPTGLLYFDSTQGESTHLFMAAVTMSLAPMVLLFAFLQRYLVRGIQSGAVKG